MKQKSRYVFRNVVSGIISKILQLILPFAVRTIIIYQLGIAYAGINSLFTSVFNIFNLTELGIGAALNYMMYKPVAEQDTGTMNAIINLYHKWYRNIGLIICILNSAFMPLLPLLIPEGFPEALNFYLVYLLYFVSMVLPYFIKPYATPVLSAHLREDIITQTASISIIGQSILQILAVWLFRDYYLYSLCIVLSALFNALWLFRCCQKQYPQYHCEGNLPVGLMQTVKKDVKALFMHKIGETVLFSADNIVISTLLGQTALGIYGNYYLIIIAVSGLWDMIFNSFRALIGTNLVTKTPEQNYEDFKRLCFWDITLLGVCTSVLLCVFEKFMILWVGESNLLPFRTMLLLVILFYTLRMDGIVGLYRTSLGMWEQDKWRPIISSVCNIIINVFLTMKIGLDGVVISSVICLTGFQFLNTSVILHKYYFKKSSKFYYLKHIKYDLLNLLACTASLGVCSFLPANGISGLLLSAVTAAAVSGTILLISNIKSPYLAEMRDIITSKLKK